MSAIESLQKLGLSKYQAMTYECLIRKGPLDARTLSSESHVPMGKIYDTLAQLLENIIITQKSGRPKMYEAIIPEIAFQRIYMRHYVEHEKQRDALKTIITQLEQDLERNAASFSPVQDLKIVNTNEEILDYLINAHKEARRDVIYVSHVRYGSFTSELDERTLYSLINNIGSLLRQGISVRVIFPESPYVHFFSQITTQILNSANERPDLELLEIRLLNTEHNFILIDEKTCIFELEDQRDLIRPYIMIRVRDPFLNSQLRDRFQRLWEMATCHH